MPGQIWRLPSADCAEASVITSYSIHYTKLYEKTGEIVKNALKAGVVVPAFNVPHLPMVESVIKAVTELDSFALVQVARLEWEKFESKSLMAVRDEFVKFDNPKNVRLHLDHVRNNFV